MTVHRRGQDLLHHERHVALRHGRLEPLVVVQDAREEVSALAKLRDEVDVAVAAAALCLFLLVVDLVQLHDVRVVQRLQQFDLGVDEVALQLRLHRNYLASANELRLPVPHDHHLAEGSRAHVAEKLVVVEYRQAPLIRRKHHLRRQRGRGDAARGAAPRRPPRDRVAARRRLRRGCGRRRRGGGRDRVRGRGRGWGGSGRGSRRLRGLLSNILRGLRLGWGPVAALALVGSLLVARGLTPGARGAGARRGWPRSGRRIRRRRRRRERCGVRFRCLLLLSLLKMVVVPLHDDLPEVPEGDEAALAGEVLEDAGVPLVLGQGHVAEPLEDHCEAGLVLRGIDVPSLLRVDKLERLLAERITQRCPVWRHQAAGRGDRHRNPGRRWRSCTGRHGKDRHRHGRRRGRRHRDGRGRWRRAAGFELKVGRRAELRAGESWQKGEGGLHRGGLLERHGRAEHAVLAWRGLKGGERLLPLRVVRHHGARRMARRHVGVHAHAVAVARNLQGHRRRPIH
mmetsp:Transcript_106641/g.308552  ORF Transcript_106641/g.308552 Transcript_106641/m.308552 type:complete len:511 (-) Transcript_106641:142-1674(-)